ncbi:mads-box protein jointless, partial [Quercus suber]
REEVINGGMRVKEAFPILLKIDAPQDLYQRNMQQVIERHNLHPDNLGKMDQLSLELQLENGASYAMLSKEIEDKTHELRKMKGEDLHGMDIEELQKLEKVLDGRFLEEITALQQKVMFQTLNPCKTFHTIITMFARQFQNRSVPLCKRSYGFNEKHLRTSGALLMEENRRLKQIENLFSTQTHVLEQGQSFESIINICSSSDPQDNDSSDISLKLGRVTSGRERTRRARLTIWRSLVPETEEKVWGCADVEDGRLLEPWDEEMGAFADGFVENSTDAVEDDGALAAADGVER